MIPDARHERVSRIAHDVNNQLAVVIGNTEVLRATSTEPFAQELLGEVLDAASRATALVGLLPEDEDR